MRVFQRPELDVPTPRAVPSPGAHSPAALAGCPAGGGSRPVLPSISPMSAGRGLSQPFPQSPPAGVQPTLRLARQLLCGCGFPRPSALGGLAGEGGMCRDEPHSEASPQGFSLKTASAKLPAGSHRQHGPSCPGEQGTTGTEGEAIPLGGRPRKTEREKATLGFPSPPQRQAWAQAGGGRWLGAHGQASGLLHHQPWPQSGPPHFASSASHPPPCPPVCPAQLGLGGRWWEGAGLRVSLGVGGGKRLAVPRRRSPRPGGPHASGHSRWARGPSSSWWPLAASCPITKQERRSASRAVPSRRLWSSVLASSIWIYRKPASPHGASCRVGEASRSPQFEQSSARLA